MDYVLTFETIEIGPSFGNETVSVGIDIIDDDRAESSETFFIRLLPVGRGVRLESGRDEAIVNIIDDDPGNIIIFVMGLMNFLEKCLQLDQLVLLM